MKTHARVLAVVENAIDIRSSREDLHYPRHDGWLQAPT
jgi:hypothetical protein